MERVAIVTGGSQGIGAGVVDAYRRRGWGVVASARTVPPPADDQVLAVEGDITEAGVADRIIDGALRRFGPVDGELLAVALLEEEAGLRLRHGPA